MPAAWKIGSVKQGLSAEEARYVARLRELARAVASSQCELAGQLHLDASVVSRKLRGETLAGWRGFTEPLAKLAASFWSAHDTDRNWNRLKKLHIDAHQGRDQRKLQERLARLRGKTSFAVADKGVASAHLPVPRQEGDRQVSKKPVPAAHELAAWISSLEGSPEAQLAALRHSTEALTPAECAASAVLLGGGDCSDGASRTFVELFGRDQSDRRVMRFALELLAEYGLHEPAKLALRMALRLPVGAP